MGAKVKVIMKPERKRTCDTCHTEIAGQQLRFFGSPDDSVHPSAYYVHPWCSKETRKRLGLSLKKGQAEKKYGRIL